MKSPAHKKSNPRSKSENKKTAFFMLILFSNSSFHVYKTNVQFQKRSNIIKRTSQIRYFWMISFYGKKLGVPSIPLQLNLWHFLARSERRYHEDWNLLRISGDI